MLEVCAHAKIHLCWNLLFHMRKQTGSGGDAGENIASQKAVYVSWVAVAMNKPGLLHKQTKQDPT